MKIHFFLLAFLGIVACQLTNAKSHSDSLNEFWSSEEEIKCEKNEFYSFRSDQCLTCSKCGPEMYEKEECSEFKDTVCGGCFVENTIRNDDFFEKCSDHEKMFKNLKKIFKEIYAEAENVEERKTTSNYIVRNWQWINVSLIISITLALLLVGIWALCTMRRQYTRIINVTPPQLSEVDNHNIIYASKKIQEKLANRRESIPYEYL